MAIKVSGAKPKRKKKSKTRGLLSKIGKKLFGGRGKKRGRGRGKASKSKAGASSD